MKKTIGIIVAAVLVIALIPATRDEFHWQWACYKDKTGSYESYVKTWPDGHHAAEAQARYDEHHWADSQAANTVRSYRSYTSAHPQGKFVQQAEMQAEKLNNDRAPYEAALHAGTMASLSAFLSDYPGHIHEAAAQQALKEITEGRDIVDLVGENKIEIKAQGSGIERVSIRMRRLVQYPLTVRIPAGSYFVSSNANAQNMVTTAEKKVRLIDDKWVSVSADAACANRPKAVPDSSDTFTVQRSPHQADLAKLIPVLDKAMVYAGTRQAAVWIVTDDADYDDLGTLVDSPFGFGGSRVIKERDTARAMQICEEAGIDITQKAVWKDRQRIISGLKDIDLKTWLEQKR